MVPGTGIEPLTGGPLGDTSKHNMQRQNREIETSMRNGDKERKRESEGHIAFQNYDQEIGDIFLCRHTVLWH